MSDTQSAPAADGLSDAQITEIDTALVALTQGAERWASAPLIARAELLERTRDTTSAAADEWVVAAMAAKGTPAYYAGEEWLSGPYGTIRNLDVVAASLRALAHGQSPAAKLKAEPAPGGRTALRVLPADAKDLMLLNGFSADVWSTPGTSEPQMRADAGLGAKQTNVNGGVGLVLGAGNIASIGPQDILYELVAFNRASILKLNPTFAGLRPAYEKALAPLIEFGVLRIVNGGAAVGGHLTADPRVGHVHITGSAITHDLIVWGAGEEAEERRAANTPKLEKEITSELGGVAPIIVVPGDWTTADLRFQAENVATMRFHNSGHNCIAGQTLILSSDWPQRQAFLDELRAVIDEMPARQAWYPGTDKKIALAEASYPQAEHHANRILIEVGPEDSSDLFCTEYFGPVLGHTTLAGTGLEFLNAAVAFANEKLEGTLGANVLIEPGQRASYGAAFDEAMAELRYGTIAINAWTAMGFLTAGAPWGAFPGHTLQDVGSGIGTVHNAFLLDHVERCVITGPFRPAPRSIVKGELAMSPKPPWFVTAKTGAATAEKITHWSAKRPWAGLPAIVLSALRA